VRQRVTARTEMKRVSMDWSNSGGYSKTS